VGLGRWASAGAGFNSEKVGQLVIFSYRAFLFGARKGAAWRAIVRGISGRDQKKPPYSPKKRNSFRRLLNEVGTGQIHDDFGIVLLVVPQAFLNRRAEALLVGPGSALCSAHPSQPGEGAQEEDVGTSTGH